MTLTKSQKMSAGVLAVAVIAFVVDRFVLAPADGAGGSASAGTSGYAVAKPSSAPSQVTRPAKTTGASASAQANATAPQAITNVATRLSAISQQRRLNAAPCGDAFRPADVWLAALFPPPAPPKPVASISVSTTRPAAPKVDHAAEFRKRHSLTAVMKKQAGGMAIVDGKLYAAGQTLDGFKLVRIGLNDATFAGKGTTIVLRMSQPPVADAR
jgi:hypothetical protein